jgi:GT2 family glycosyltransferase
MAVDVSILIISYNTCELTTACLDSLRAAPDTVTTEVVVVDNASTDDTVAVLTERYPWVRLIEQPTNLGFARAVNIAAGAATGRYVLLLNSDTVVIDDAVSRLVAFAEEHPHYGVYGGRTVRPDRTLDPSSCWGAPTLWSHLCFGFGLTTALRGSRLFDPESLGTWQRDTAARVGVVTGCLLLVRRDLFTQLGGLDPRYFMYGEDVDFSLRARAAGYDPVITPTATVVHHSGASSSRHADKTILTLTGKTTLARTHRTGWQRAFCLAMLVLGVALRAGLAMAAGRTGRTGRGTSGNQGSWRTVWQARARWWPGYSPYPADAPGQLTTSLSPATGASRGREHADAVAAAPEPSASAQPGLL